MEPIIVQLFIVQAILSVAVPMLDLIELLQCVMHERREGKREDHSHSYNKIICYFTIVNFFWHVTLFIIHYLSLFCHCPATPYCQPGQGTTSKKSSRNYFLTITIKKSILSKKISQMIYCCELSGGPSQRFKNVVKCHVMLFERKMQGT